MNDERVEFVKFFHGIDWYRRKVGDKNLPDVVFPYRKFGCLSGYGGISVQIVWNIDVRVRTLSRLTRRSYTSSL